MDLLKDIRYIFQIPLEWFKRVDARVFGDHPGSGIKFEPASDGSRAVMLDFHVLDDRYGGGASGTVTAVDGVGPNASGNVVLNALVEADLGVEVAAFEHSHGNITSEGKMSSEAACLVVTDATGEICQYPNSREEGGVSVSDVKDVANAFSVTDLGSSKKIVPEGYLDIDQDACLRIFSGSNDGLTGWVDIPFYTANGVQTGSVISGCDNATTHGTYIRAYKGGLYCGIRVGFDGTNKAQQLDQEPSEDDTSDSSVQIASRGWSNKHFARKTVETAPSEDKVLTILEGATSATWESAGGSPVNPSTKTTANINGEGTSTANTTSWTYDGTKGMQLTVCSRVMYDHTAATPVLYGFYRTWTFDQKGRLYSISGETRYEIDTPVVYTGT